MSKMSKKDAQDTASRNEYHVRKSSISKSTLETHLSPLRMWGKYCDSHGKPHFPVRARELGGFLKSIEFSELFNYSVKY